ncbi:uncharacterized protein DEA37_0002982 [Paragonimus westermani]|uniref:Uncharacterized protein n=1 Tax=Paragonimus westermani TaxID=34504 RepID=A0A5J4P1X9_9TREM|nr:uncharacterized protein DEA37_0002982 [Paragonimus westermani]
MSVSIDEDIDAPLFHLSCFMANVNISFQDNCLQTTTHYRSESIGWVGTTTTHHMCSNHLDAIDLATINQQKLTRFNHLENRIRLLQHCFTSSVHTFTETQQDLTLVYANIKTENNPEWQMKQFVCCYLIMFFVISTYVRPPRRVTVTKYIGD